MMKHPTFLVMLPISALLVAVAWGVRSSSPASPAPDRGNVPAYTSDGRLALPANYREWVFLSSGFGMNYSNGGGSHPMFTNVYVSPEAYQGFKSAGKWPDKSMFVVEIYSPASQGSINKSGYYQDTFMGLDVEVKDSSQKNQWSYFNFDPGEAAAARAGGGCNKCHSEHAAVEHTFVQFYPTLLSFAREKNLLKPGR
ncbi:MAG TPA: cytochrome P460 family protein [Candidatus Limnocylindrales bacterium]|nr:cytochrome P460 family protein [Candidatus Limnocylindrales bacterium]